ncbi:fucose-specific lectin [Sistotremastrum niveocremeum HHB9708]|uniref:Fucose-specific lectin n=2 Tax=Sistotremastraceae TaxID=3402574 RepID=A0A164PW06_9AGAM|nr:fucose-specific lectin [Sistotremastrum niveocremeum HHB9708]KZT34429.1 fucose-specific lectin [Sistotremastrum suecicum HHB10207 ss-3]
MSNIRGTGIAAVQWIHGAGLHIRVYHQHTDGGVYETALDPNPGQGWHSTKKIFQARLRSPLAAVAFQTSGNAPQIRVYYLDDHNVIQEYAFNNGWAKGSTLPSSNVYPISSLAAVSWSDDPHIRVYYQQADNNIQEIAFDKGWHNGSTLSAGFPGTAITATTLGDGASSLRVYYQEPDLKLHESAWGGGWHDRTLDTISSPAGGIAAIGWTQSNGHHLRVYSQSQQDQITELSYNGTTNWVYPPFTPLSGLLPSDGALAAIVWLESGSVQIRVYGQTFGGRNITELVYDGPGRKGWYSQVLGF